MQNTGTKIDTIASLTKVVGRTPGPRNLKVIDHIDTYAKKWIDASTCLFVTVDNGEKFSIQAGGGQPGFVTADTNRLTVPVSSMDQAAGITAGSGWGSLLLVPGWKESLRVNGTVTEVDNSQITVAVDECYLHCAKAFMRSRFWQAQPSTQQVDSAADFAAQSNFMLVGTSNAGKQADLSPKGDPPGKLLQFQGKDILFPDRPGNKRVDGFRNIISRPSMEIVALVPGSTQLLRMSGQVSLYSKSPLAEHFAVDGKQPKLVGRMENAETSLETSPALEQARLWPAEKTDLGFRPSELWQAHMKLSKEKGLEATLAKAAISVPGALQVMLDQDYKNNMY
jgi:predicted pyridoxine 5'-phosphate oxidase superfamily flavin-nucleotide-binding protein